MISLQTLVRPLLTIFIALSVYGCALEEELAGSTYIGPNGLSELHFLNDSLLIISRIERSPDTVKWVQRRPFIYIPFDTLKLSGQSLDYNGHSFQPFTYKQKLKLRSKDLIYRKFSYLCSKFKEDHVLFMDNYFISYNKSMDQPDLDWKLVNFKGRQYLKLSALAPWTQYYYLNEADGETFEFTLYDPDNFSYHSASMVAMD